MKYLFSLMILLSFHCAMSQYNSEEKEELDLEMLQAPSSPAANLLGISDSDIQKPSDRNELVGLIRQSSDNFSSLPTSFAFDYSPFKKGLYDFMNYDPEKKQANSKVNLKSNLRQSFVLSVATQSLDSAKDEVLVSSQQFGIGIKFSLARGTLDKSFQEKIMKMQSIKRRVLPEMVRLKEERIRMKNDSLKLLIDAEMKKSPPQRDMSKVQEWNMQRSKIDSTETLVVDKMFEKQFDEIKTLTEKLSYDRFGFKWDVAAGLVLDFPNSSFDDGNLTKAGIWTVFGHEGQKSGMSFLGLIRYMYNPDKIYADENNTNVLESNVSTLDLGGRFILGNKNKLSGSLEAIYRSASVSEIESSWRFTLNTSYDVSKNQKLTFIFGRDFDGTITKNGNVIAALSYVRGFGSKLQL